MQKEQDHIQVLLDSMAPVYLFDLKWEATSLVQFLGRSLTFMYSPVYDLQIWNTKYTGSHMRMLVNSGKSTPLLDPELKSCNPAIKIVEKNEKSAII